MLVGSCSIGIVGSCPPRVRCRLRAIGRELFSDRDGTSLGKVCPRRRGVHRLVAVGMKASNRPLSQGSPLREPESDSELPSFLLGMGRFASATDSTLPFYEDTSSSKGAVPKLRWALTWQNGLLRPQKRRNQFPGFLWVFLGCLSGNCPLYRKERILVGGASRPILAIVRLIPIATLFGMRLCRVLKRWSVSSPPRSAWRSVSVAFASGLVGLTGRVRRELRLPRP